MLSSLVQRTANHLLTGVRRTVVDSGFVQRRHSISRQNYDFIHTNIQTNEKFIRSDASRNEIAKTSPRRRSYSTTQQTLLAEGGDKVPSSSYLDSIQSHTTSWWKKAVEKTSNIANDAAATTMDTTKKLAEDAALKTQQMSQDAANQAAKTASKLSQSAAEAAKEQAASLTKATSATLSKASEAAKESLQKQASHLSKATAEKLSKATQSVTQSARDSVKATQDATHQAYHRNIQKPLQDTSKTISDTTEKLVDNITNSGTKLLRYLAMWSLAAVFVYGMATTLPLQLIKYGMEKGKQEKEQPVVQATPVPSKEKPTITRWWS